MSDPKYDGYDAEVVITTADGRRLTHRSGGHVLRGPGYPMTEAEIFGKFHDCSSRVLPKGNIKQLFSMLCGLENLDSLKAVSTLIDVGKPAAMAS